MGFRFRKSISIGKGLRLNLNKKSIGFSVGTKGMRFSINSKGRKTANVGIPGTGLYYTKTNNSSTTFFTGFVIWYSAGIIVSNRLMPAWTAIVSFCVI